MLQSLLNPRYQTRPVYVRRERRRLRARRPSQLQLQPGRPAEADLTPTPEYEALKEDLYVCGKVAGLYAVVGSILLGIVVLVVGLVQLSPGAEAAQHRYYLIISGVGLIGIGVFAGLFRCLCLHWLKKSLLEGDALEIALHKNRVTTLEAGAAPGHKATPGHKESPGHKATHGHKESPGQKATPGHKEPHGHEHRDKPKLKPQASRDQGPADLIKQASTTSET